MEKLEKKHNHKLTDLLKVGIFGLMLLLPFLIFLPTGCYYGHNEHATATRVEPEIVNFNQLFNFREYNNEIVTSTFTDDLVNLVINNDGNETAFRLSENFTYKLGDKIYLRVDPNIFTNQNAAFQIFFNDPSNGYPYINSYIYDVIFDIQNIPSGNIYLGCQIPSNYQITCSFYCNIFNLTEMYGSGNEPTIQEFNNQWTQNYYEPTTGTKIIINKPESISWNMYYSWQDLWNTPLFSWTNTSILRTGLKNFTSVFGVNDTAYITNLITYELIIVAIYIVIDIVIEIFKWLTHLIGEK